MDQNSIVHPTIDEFYVSPVFRDVPRAWLEAIAPCARVVHYPHRNLIVKEGSLAREFGWLLDGNADVFLSADYDHLITLMTLSKGMSFGWSSMVAPHIYQWTVKAHDGCKVVLLDTAVVSRMSIYTDLEKVLLHGVVSAMSQRLWHLKYELVSLLTSSAAAA